jgi:hypothetical protein
MPKLICFLTTQTNGLHESHHFVTKKHLFEFARPVLLQYVIGYRQGNEFIETNKEKFIFEPECMVISKEAEDIHGISFKKANKKGEKSEYIMQRLKNDLKNVSVIVSHSIGFHIKAIQVECFRTNVFIDFSNYILIDTMKFHHKLDYPKLKELSKNIINKSYKNKKPNYNITIIKKCFMKLYEDYEKSILAK